MDGLIYQKIVGFKEDLSGPQHTPSLLADSSLSSSSDTDESGDSESDNDDAEDKGSKFVNSARPKNESMDSKKVMKKYVLKFHFSDARKKNQERI